MEKKARLFVMYHDPCLDGVYAMTGMMLPILTKIRRDKWTIPMYMEFLEEKLEKIKLKQENQQETQQQQQQQQQCEKLQGSQEQIKEQVETQQYNDQQLDDKGFFYTRIDDLYYIPMKLTENADEVQKVLKYLNDLNNCILIILDYFGRTWDNLQFMSRNFKYVIVIDHHMTCVNALINQEKYEIEKYRQLNYFQDNIFLLINTDKAACELVLDFHEIINDKKYNQLVPQNLGDKLLIFAKYIADNDLFVLQYPETEPLQMAIMKLKLQYDARQNQLIIQELLNLDFNFMVKRGKLLATERNKKVNEILQKRKTICFNKNARGYAIYCDDLSILNPLGNALAILSMKCGDHNLSAVYHNDKKNEKQFKIHLRSAHHDDQWNLLERFRCDVLAESFGGGGHVGAASMYMTKQKWMKFIYE